MPINIRRISYVGNKSVIYSLTLVLGKLYFIVGFCFYYFIILASVRLGSIDLHFVYCHCFFVFLCCGSKLIQKNCFALGLSIAKNSLCARLLVDLCSALACSICDSSPLVH